VADLFAARLAQRERALADGLDLLGWTFDPLDVEAAAVGVARLGAVVERYLPDVDRLVAEWWIRRPHVERRIASAGRLTVRARDAADAPVLTPSSSPLPESERRVWVAFDAGARAFLADVLPQHFARGYRIVDFMSGEHRETGRYLLARSG
jgi:predicted GNAT superfamily acetyltransferase